MRSVRIIFLTLTLALAAATVVHASSKCPSDPPETALSAYNIDPDSIMLSGLSAGGFMATQYHFAHDAEVAGAALIASGPYWCANANAHTAQKACMKEPKKVSVKELWAAVDFALAAKSIDDPYKAMTRDRLFIFSGSADSVIVSGVVKKTMEFYEKYVLEENLEAMFDFEAEHAYPTTSYGVGCLELSEPYIASCDLNLSYKYLDWLYDGVKDPVPAVEGNFFSFSQTKYSRWPGMYSGLHHTGYLYVPTACQDATTQCKLMIHFHGCHQSPDDLCSEYAENVEINEVAEANNIIVLYPQARSTILNPKSCWDWWGYTGPAYATKLAPQIRAVHKMSNALRGIHSPEDDDDEFSAPADLLAVQGA